MKSKTPLEARGTKDDFIPFYTPLDSDSKLYKSITDTINLIKKNPTLGDHVAHNKIPTYYIKKYHIRTLFRIELIDYWRLLYSIQTFDDIGMGILVLDVLDHEKYNTRFGYKS
ncbi:hypothetical protein YTPLAS73_05080 [Nitrosarchaeum sp.]|nr:hypothetical protein YTPLAS73_05080 [Nitrosarchaeum sp.]